MEWAETNCYLNEAEAHTLIDFTLLMADHGFPLSHTSLEKYALEIRCIQCPDAKPFGKQWAYYFLTKYRSFVSTTWGTSLDSIHASAVNLTKVKAWFDLLYFKKS